MGGLDRLGNLTAALDRHRTELQRLPGVVGTGVGIPSGADRASDPVIQVFVRSSDNVDELRRQVGRILPQIPVEFVVTGEVTAG